VTITALILNSMKRTYIYFKISKSITILLFSIALLHSCASDDHSPRRGGSEQQIIPYNIIILIDLSDRDLSNNKPKLTTDIPIDHDILAVKLILSSLKETFQTLTIEDKITIVPAPQDNAIFDAFYKTSFNKLKMDMTKVFEDLKKEHKPALSIPLRKKRFEELSDTLINTLTKLENIAQKDQHPMGGDITLFFNDKLRSYFKNGYQNVLIIFTDGDEAFNKSVANGRPEIAFQGNYTGLKILMLGINVPNASQNPNKINQVYNYWINKFNSIKINKDDIDFNENKSFDLLGTKIKEFIKTN
jgi:hypothetical protein